MKPVCLDPLFEGYLEYQRTVRRLAPKSIVDIRCTLKRAVTGLEQKRPSASLWKLSLEDYMGWVNQQREEGYLAQSLNKDIYHLRGLLEYAWRSGRADRNVLDGFSLQDSVRVVMPKFLSIEEARRLVAACPIPTLA
jgi:site-specific recombinase XerD